MRLIVELSDYDLVFQEMLPYLPNVSMRQIVDCLIDDLNGLITYCHLVYRNEPMPEDPGILHLVQYLMENYDGQTAMDSVRSSCLNIYFLAIDNLIYQLTRDPHWINSYYRIESFDTGVLSAFRRLKLVLSVQERYTLPLEIADKFYRLTRSTLSAVCRS